MLQFISFYLFKKKQQKYEVFELNREECRLVVCPLLLNPNSYIPDLIDLTKDEEARHYWLGCFEKTINTVIIFTLFHILYIYLLNITFSSMKNNA